ncbi:hypothetical protein ABB55_12100 [Prosthecomicrobium hirschii]|uniref:Uncharacterized protein n=1 Tax=Prosthecodimorpha hirschii TaxID=665126 RepID=A0A0P6W175_9HYPH|nr:hypothetical protein [Prosthecomicrobium hirschii]KPL52864.1 hypothetical protein ABB55_12100 [Prosthecomicrobium hirschii]
MLKDAQIEKLVTPKLQEMLGPYGFASAHAESGFDHDGDPVVFLYANYREHAPELDALKALKAISETMNLLREHGDERFVHLRHVYPDDDYGIDDDEAAQ